VKPTVHVAVKHKEELLPAPRVRLWLGAPSPDGLWTMRIDNDDARPARVPADIRTLHIEVDETDGKRKKTFKCELPAALRPSGFPDRRALLLAPGESYVESFDPHLFCFGKNAAALKGGNAVRAYLGWPAPKYGQGKKFAPHAVDPTDDPAPFASVAALDAPTGVLSFESDAGASWTQNQWIAPNAPPPPKPPPLVKSTLEREHNVDHYTSAREQRIASASRNRRRWDQPVNIVYHPEPPPKQKPKVEEDHSHDIVDENAPRLDLAVSEFVEAGGPGRISMTFTTTNVGKRPMLVVLRPRMIGLNVDGPDGLKRCEAGASTGAVARDAFRTLNPGQTIKMTLLLGEICPVDVFSRPGLYKVQATLDANESGAELGLSAYVGSSVSEHGWLRLAAAPEPFYATMPKPIPIDKLADDETK
jgi:hypothetical protein